MPSSDRVAALIALVEAGRFVEALEGFYHEDATMRENNAPPRTSRAESIARQRRNADLGARIEAVKANAVLVDGDRSAIEWHAAWQFDDGRRYRIEEVALQRWQGDRIIEERFFYDPAPLGDLAHL